MKGNSFFVFQRSHRKIEDSEESSDEILARLTSAVRPRAFPSEGCGNNERRVFEGRHLGSDVGTLALWLLIIVGGTNQGERRPWHRLAYLVQPVQQDHRYSW